MMQDVILLAVMANKVNFNKYRKYIKKATISLETSKLLDDYERHFAAFTAVDDISMSDFTTWFCTIRHPSMKQDELTFYKKLLIEIDKEIAAPSAIASSVIEHFIELDYAHRLRHESDLVANGTSNDMSEVLSILTEYKDHKITIDPDEELFATTNIVDLVATQIAGGGLDWRLEDLNEILGPLRKGDFIVVAARPETGKTTLLASEVTHMVTQLPDEQTALWICNEEGGDKIQFRVFQAALGRTRADIMADVPKAQADIVAELGSADKINVYHRPYINYRDIDVLCDKINPGLIIFDQLDKIQGFKGDRDDLKLQKIYQWAREKANQFGPVISVSQCDGTAEGVRYCLMSQLAGSKTAKQGEADAIIMIGADHDPSMEFIRFLNVPKNKLAGGPVSLESRRHGKAEVVIKPDIARYATST